MKCLYAQTSPFLLPHLVHYLAQHSHSIYALFQTVVLLTEDIRQPENNPQAEEFQAILLCLRDGQSTQDDWIKLGERTPQHVNMSDFTKAPWLFFDKVLQSTTLTNTPNLQQQSLAYQLLIQAGMERKPHPW